jgi:hypothetical protein
MTDELHIEKEMEESGLAPIWYFLNMCLRNWGKPPKNLS